MRGPSVGYVWAMFVVCSLRQLPHAVFITPVRLFLKVYTVACVKYRRVVCPVMEDPIHKNDGVLWISCSQGFHREVAFIQNVHHDFCQNIEGKCDDSFGHKAQ